MPAPPTREQLEAAHCWDPDDESPQDPAMTEFRRRTRFHQAMWREAHGHPVGTQPYRPAPGKPARPVGSRIPLEYGLETGANLVSPAALDAARKRTSVVERHQSFDHQRLWADLLSSEALAFNLFGDLAADVALGDRAVHAWWPDVPGTVAEVRFAHSPGRLDPAWLNSLRAFDAAIVLRLADGTRGVIGVDTNYHERLKPETPKPENLWRYVPVAEQSGVFAPGAIDRVKGRSRLAVMWLEHLLLHSMLQHPSGEWTWGRYVVVHPAKNSSVASACAEYGTLLADDATFATMTLEAILGSRVLPATMTAALRDRYVPLGWKPG